MEAEKLVVKKRTLEGSASSRRLRAKGSLPGVVYGGKNEAQCVELETHAIEQVLHHHSSESILLDIELEGEGVTAVLIKEVQHHPVTGALVHVDLQRVSANKPIQVEVPLELKGEPEGVKAGGLLDHVQHAIVIEALPGDMVECIEVDVSALEIGQALHVSDVQVDNKLTILTDGEQIVAAVAAPKVVEEEVEAEDTASEPEVITEKTEEE